MKYESEHEQQMVGYLLGSLSAEEQARLEERYFSDDGYYEELLATADDLIRAYLVGSLSPEERTQFESHFLASSWRRQRLEFVRDLTTVLDRPVDSPALSRQPAPSSARWSGWAVAAIIVMASALVILLWLSRGPGPDVKLAHLTPAPPPQPASAAPSVAPSAVTPSPGGQTSQGSPAPPKRSPVYAVRVPRDAAEPLDVVVPRPTRSVRLEVDVEGGHPSYDVVITRDGNSVWRAEELIRSTPDGPLAVTVPASVLAAGEYVLSVQGETLRDEQTRPPRVVHLRIARPR